ncbi:MAG: GIY-YIG nuclease family protein [Cyclobacteriaceae bacterium]|nr:GIY-YIG nuclease family protein [Cyclobacteriaceae bacterium]
MNKQRRFDPLQIKRLGNYVYALRDPRDRKIFYVGKGKANRVFSHFNKADKVNSNSANLNTIDSKTLRILDIWKHDEDVEWIILAHNLAIKHNITDYVESAIFDCLSESQNGDTLNENVPPKSSRLSPDDIIAFAAGYVNPKTPLATVFIFPIHNTAQGLTSIYNATRAAWYVTRTNQNVSQAYATGLKNSISIGSFEISKWVAASIVPGKHEFTAPNHPNPLSYQPLLNKNFTKILAKAKGFWQRGNYLIVEFDGHGKFRIKRGSQDKSWYNCI